MKKRRGQIGRTRPHNALVKTKRALPEVYLSDSNQILPEIYLPDPGARHSGSSFKWLVSTCIAAVVGVAAIGMAMYASMDIEENGGGMLTTLQRASIDGMRPVEKATPVTNRLRVASRKTDRLIVTSYGLSTRYTIHDRVAQKRGNREFIVLKPYSKIVATLSTAQPADTKSIPKFNPFKLYANTTPLTSSSRNARGRKSRNITVKTVKLTPASLTSEDGQFLTLEAIQKIIRDAGEQYNRSKLAAKSEAYQNELEENSSQNAARKKLPPRTTVIEKSEDVEDQLPEQREIQVVKFRQGDSLTHLIREAGASNTQAAAMARSMNTIFPATSIQVGHELRFILVPKQEDAGKVEPIAISLFAGHRHKVSVVKSGVGEYTQYRASKRPINLSISKDPKKNFTRRSTVYLSMYHAAKAQNIPRKKIMQILRVHSYDVDFKRRVQSGDNFQAFFDEKRTGNNKKDGKFGELLFTSTTIAGETKGFYRFRTPDGAVDYYDENGSSAKKFLMRKPVRGARYSSGFGPRFHPILKRQKMHYGADWAAPTGTPILAAGNGTVIYAKRNGSYGNFVRIRHANGYKTQYAHLHRFAKGMKKGTKVRQGQVIGYVGSTGRSSGPHLHYEVLVNNRHVNPMKIDVPRGRKLSGSLLTTFRKEKQRIDRLMRQPAVKTRVAKVAGQS